MACIQICSYFGNAIISSNDSSLLKILVKTATQA
jgi:hypothetical protein